MRPDNLRRDASALPHMKILLVEDHADSRRNLQRLIERRGHEVVAVGSAEEAEAALRQRYDSRF